MKITKIEKKKRLYLLETDQNQKVYITEDTIIHFMLSKGKEISESTFKEIETFAQLSYGKNLALYYLSFKQRTSKEVADYLLNYQIQEDNIIQIIQQLKESNWINDRHYTEQFLYQNSLSGDKGPNVLSYKLSQKGVGLSIINEEMEKIDFSPIADRLAQKLLIKYQNKLPQRALKDKLLKQMLNKGFTYELGKQSISHLEWQDKQEIESNLLQKELEKQYYKLSRKYQDYDLRKRLTQTLMRKGYDYSDITSALRDYL